jgi:tetratricopeptide (TPR) repeat protein
LDQGLKYRFWEIDLLRGIAVVGMILFHLVFDLSYFGAFDLEVRSGLWLGLARSTAYLFILLVGVSLSLAAMRARVLYPKEKLYLKLVRRGVGIFALGMAVTAVTYILFNEEFIIFGVLHFIGIAVVLAYPLSQEAYKSALKIAPKNSAAWDNRGISLGCLGRHKEAVECFEKALDIDPNNTKAWNNLGIALLLLKNYGDSIMAFNRALELDESQTNAQHNRNLALSAAADNARAINNVCSYVAKTSGKSMTSSLGQDGSLIATMAKMAAMAALN